MTSATLTVHELREELNKLGLDSKGVKPQLRQRLRKARTSQTNGIGFSLEQSSPQWMPEYDSYLVLDVEATCEVTRRYGYDDRGPPVGSPGAYYSAKITNYDYPNEIIEFPVVLLQWNESCTQLEIRDTFQSYVRPIWRPKLSQFCKDLTGITQEQVDAAPAWNEVTVQLYSFLKKHDLLKLKTHDGKGPSRMHDRRLRAGVTWVTHGPHDLRDFVIKQCWISGKEDRVDRGAPPMFLRGPVVDIRKGISTLFDWEVEYLTKAARHHAVGTGAAQIGFGGPDGFQVVSRAPDAHRVAGPAPNGRSLLTAGGLTKQDLSLKGLLELLGLGAFIGREHCGLDDTRNVARLVMEVGRRIAAMSEGEEILFHRNVDQGGGGSVKASAAAPAAPASWQRRRNAERADKMEKTCLTPNIRTDRVEKRWRFMGKDVGTVEWRFPPEAGPDYVVARSSNPPSSEAKPGQV